MFGQVLAPVFENVTDLTLEGVGTCQHGGAQEVEQGHRRCRRGRLLIEEFLETDDERYVRSEALQLPVVEQRAIGSRRRVAHGDEEQDHLDRQAHALARRGTILHQEGLGWARADHHLARWKEPDKLRAQVVDRVVAQALLGHFEPAVDDTGTVLEAIAQAQVPQGVGQDSQTEQMFGVDRRHVVGDFTRPLVETVGEAPGAVIDVASLEGLSRL